MILNRGLLASLSALALAACAVGPDYVAPNPPLASSGPFLSAQGPAITVAEPSANWWRLYEDPVLDRLVADALVANTDVRVALANIERARAGLRSSRAGRLPQASVGAGASYGRVPEAQRPPGEDAEDWTFDGGVDVGYEVDLFGRVGRDIEASRGELQAVEADANTVRLIVVADTTRAYADAASGAARLNVAHQVVELLDRSLTLMQRRREAGLATGLDVAQIAALREQRTAQVPLIETERQAALFRLATLTGRSPADLPPIAAERAVPLTVVSAIPVGDGAQLLARRPDVRAAERRLAAATARIGVATADLYPRVTLGGSAGSTAAAIGDLFTGGAVRWLLGSLLSWNLNQEPARARIAAAEAETQARLAEFDGAVLGALEETEVALSSYTRSLERRQALVAARDQAARAAEITRAQQREGAVDALRFLDVQRTYTEAEAALAEQDAEVSRRQVDVFRALGGGWAI
jgi:NodT family efflux transporter outer membrane factor (OMF) lipoprotein